jgi:hypothetical protein
MHHNNNCIIYDLSLCYPLSSFIIIIYPCATPCHLSSSFLVLLQRWCHHFVRTKLVVLSCTVFSMFNSSLRYSSYFAENTVNAQLLLRPQFIRHRQHDKNNTQGNWQLLLFELLNHPTDRSSMNQIRVATSCCHYATKCVATLNSMYMKSTSILNYDKHYHYVKRNSGEIETTTCHTIISLSAYKSHKYPLCINETR